MKLKETLDKLKKNLDSGVEKLHQDFALFEQELKDTLKQEADKYMVIENKLVAKYHKDVEAAITKADKLLNK